jgi:hypothetical protein
MNARATPNGTREAICSDLDRASVALGQLAHRLLPSDMGAQAVFHALEGALLQVDPTGRGFHDLGDEFPRLFRDAQRSAAAEHNVEPATFNRAAVAHIASTLHTRVAGIGIPDDMLAQIPPALERLHMFLSERGDDYDFSSGHFQRDLHVGVGWMLPCGAAVVDLRSTIGESERRALIRQRPSFRLAASLMRHGARWRWLEPHNDPRYLDEFNEPGWDRTYLRFASLLRLHPSVAGMTSSGWLNDPVMERVSPRHSHIHKRPVERGAILLRGGTSPVDIETATRTSPTRRRLYEAGEYMPVSYRLVWLRWDILRWAKKFDGRQR